MNYDAYIQAAIDEIKADKSILQPYKNYAAKAGEELKAWIHMGQNTTLREPNDPPITRSDECICPPGAQHANCPILSHRP